MDTLFWPPIQALNFRFVAPVNQLIVVNFVGMLENTILSGIIHHESGCRGVYNASMSHFRTTRNWVSELEFSAESPGAYKAFDG